MTARADYLAAHPKEAELQSSHVTAINAAIGEYRVSLRSMATIVVNEANEARRIGLLVLDFVETLPGKQLTPDFWRQLEGLFVDQHGQAITEEMLKWFMKMARDNPKPIETIQDALNYRQTMLLASGEAEFKLVGDRPPQVQHPPANPLSDLKKLLKFSELDDIWKRLRLDKGYCPNGRIRPDLAETLKVELAPTFKLVDELREELGLNEPQRRGDAEKTRQNKQD